MGTVSDAVYRARLEGYGRELKRMHRAAGEPSLRQLARRMGYAHATIHRYLNGVTLPRGEFIRDFLTALDMNHSNNLERLLTLRNEVREIIDPIGGDETGAQGDAVVWAQPQFDARRRRA